MAEKIVKDSQGLAKDLVNDCISRQAALDALGERPTVWTDDDDYALGERNQYDMDRLAIETVPSAQPERKKGKWIAVTEDGDVYKRICSCCGREAFFQNDDPDELYDGGRYELSDFCPHCGADMREDMAADVPTIAQPEIIHCRDCKWHRFDKDNIPYCYNIDYGYGWKDDDFCSRAERREVSE